EAGEDVLDAGAEHRVRTGLHEGAQPGRVQRGDRLAETDWLAQIPEPVRGIEGRRVELLAGHGGVEGDSRRARPDVGERVDDLVVDALDVVGVRGVVEDR